MRRTAAKRATRAAAALPRAAGAARAAGIVLLVDDDPIALDSMATLLRDWGFLVIASSDWRDVQRTLSDLDRETRPIVLIVDYLLGGECGLAAAKAIAATTAHDVRPIVISGATDREALAAMSASGLPQLHKPVRPGELRALIESVATG